jgi:GTP-binding protein Era
LNLLCGEQVAIVSPSPQTTRNAIRGVVNRDRGQLVLVDTPGLHLSGKKFNRRLTETALRAAGESDLILYVLDASRPPGPEEEAIAAGLASRLAGTGGGSLAAAVNKMDSPAADFARTADFLAGAFPENPLDKDRIIPLSALTGEGAEALLSALYDLAPPGEPLYPADCYTDQEIDFRIAEVIRGKALIHLRQELPHAIYVEVADREWRPLFDPGSTPGEKPPPGAPPRRRLWVRAFIVCERESQKGMIVGRGGAVIKAIGEAARKEMNRIFDWKVDLDLRVKTGKDWRRDDRVLRKLLGR